MRPPFTRSRPFRRRFARTGALRAKSGPAGYRGGREFSHQRAPVWLATIHGAQELRGTYAPQRLCFFDLSDVIRSAGGCTMPSWFYLMPPLVARWGAGRPLRIKAIRNASSRGNIPSPLRIVQGDHETGPQATPRWAASRVADLSMPAMRSCRHAPGRGRTLILVGPTQELEDQQIAATKKLSTADLRTWIGKVGWESKWRPRSYGRSTLAVPPTLDPVQDRYNQAR